jgi:hypothetical protein
MRKLSHTWFFILLVLLLVPSVAFAGGDKEETVVTQSGDRSVQVAENWGFSWRFLEDEIEFTVSAPTTGWVGIGFNPSRMMKDADYILAYVDGGQLYATDEYGTGNTKHEADDTIGGQQNVRAIEGSESNGTTRVVFAVPLDSGDQYDKVFTQGETYTVLLAYGADNADNFTGMHRGRESVEVVLD